MHGNELFDSFHQMQILDSLPLLDQERLRAFLLKCQDEQIGGFGRADDNRADLMHTYLSLAGMSLLHEPHLVPLHAPLNITRRTHQAVKHVQRRFVRGSCQNFMFSLEKMHSAEDQLAKAMNLKCNLA